MRQDKLFGQTILEMERLSMEEKSPACDRAAVDEALKVICTDTPSCVLMPKTFFVAWCGVLTLAFTGFPLPLQNMVLIL